MSEQTITPEEKATSRGEGLSEPLLIEPCRIRQDARLARRAVKERWAIPEDRKADMVGRLLDIVEKTTVEVMTKHGPVDMEGPADSNAIAAARVIVAMEGQNQDDERPTTATQVNVGVAVNGVTAAMVAAELLTSDAGRKLLEDDE